MKKRTKALVSSFRIEYIDNVNGITYVGVKDDGIDANITMDDKKAAITFLVGHHRRAGAASPIAWLHHDTLIDICNLAVAKIPVHRFKITSPVGMLKTNSVPCHELLGFQFPTYQGLRNALIKRTEIRIKEYLENHAKAPSDNVFGCYVELQKACKRCMGSCEYNDAWLCALLLAAAIDAAGCVWSPFLAVMQAKIVYEYMETAHRYKTIHPKCVHSYLIADNGAAEWWFKERFMNLFGGCMETLTGTWFAGGIADVIRRATLSSLCTFSIFEDRYRIANEAARALCENKIPDDKRIPNIKRILVARQLDYILDCIEKRTGMDRREYEKRFATIEATINNHEFHP
jgi:hypothetical protein